MIKHTVCFKLKDNSPEECNKAAQILRSMDGNVELLRNIKMTFTKKKKKKSICIR